MKRIDDPSSVCEFIKEEHFEFGRDIRRDFKYISLFAASERFSNPEFNDLNRDINFKNRSSQLLGSGLYV